MRGHTDASYDHLKTFSLPERGKESRRGGQRERERERESERESERERERERERVAGDGDSSVTVC